MPVKPKAPGGSPAVEEASGLRNWHRWSGGLGVLSDVVLGGGGCRRDLFDATPEPSTLVLFGIGLGVRGLSIRRKPK